MLDAFPADGATELRGAHDMTNQRTQLSPAAAILWASAFLLVAIIIMQAGKLPGGAAYAEMAVSNGDYSALTTSTGLGGDADPYQVLYIIDNRDEVLMAYEIEDSRTGRIELRGGGSLSNLYRRARQ
jgi:hypothetical protein